MLAYLIAQRGRVVPKEELLDEIWGDRFVSESALTTRIKSARQAVGDDGSRQTIIRTVHGKGYEFIADVHESGEEPAVSSLARVSRVSAAVQDLIGRTELLKELTVQLETSRLITLVGVGGVGKTSLVLELARTVELRYRDGVFVVELGAVLDPGATAGVLATALDVHPRRNDSLEDAVVDLLRPRQALLVLDNCEHLLDPVSSIVDRVLRAAPDVSIVTTSREPLAFPGERVWPVEPLPVALDPEAPIDVLLDVPAIELFVERATAVDPRFALDRQNAPAVVEICQRLDGIPLALELAAARVMALDVTDIAGLLDERFKLLKGVRRGVDPRHQGLEDAVRWSYDLLGDDQQFLFAQLSAFAGSFDLSAAESVCEVGDRLDVVSLLTRLAERSMLAVRRPTGGGTRYELLETLRAYGRSRLDDEDSVGLYRRHARHYAELGDHVQRGLCTDAEPSVVLMATSAFADLRAAQRFGLRVGDINHVLGVIAAIREYAMRTMRYEALTWADEALADGAAADHPLHATVRGIQAYGTWVRGEFGRALELAAEVAREERERQLEPSGLAERAAANVLLVQGDIAGGIEAMDRQLELAEASEDQSRIAHACYMRSVIHSGLGEFDEALELAERTRSIGVATGSPTDLASGWTALGYAAHDDATEALTAFAESDRIARQAHNR